MARVNQQKVGSNKIVEPFGCVIGAAATKLTRRVVKLELDHEAMHCKVIKRTGDDHDV